MRRLRDRTLALLAATVLAAGCSSTPEATTGATTGASTDASTDVPTDATTDATSSAGSPVSAAPVTDVAGSAVSSSEASDPATSAPDAAAAFPLDQYLSGRRTSGASFDAAASEAIRHWRFVPAQEVNSGRAVRSFTTVAIVFKLKT